MRSPYAFSRARQSLMVVYALTLSCAFAQTQYFRHDSGVNATTGPLPSALEDASRAWRRPVPPGHSSPLVHGGQIFLTTFQPENELATVALDLESGEQKWKKTAPNDRIESYHRVGSPAAATPACDGERLYVFFGSYGLICYQLDGTELWKFPMGPFRDEFGAGSSPVLIDGKVIISQDHDIDSFVMAIDCRTGKQVWKTSRPDAVRSYATPTVWTHDGRKEILVPGALQLISYNADDGSQRWWINGLARIVIPVPVTSGDLIYMASWSPGGDVGSRLNLESWPDALKKWDKNEDGRLAEPEINDQEVLSRFFRMDLDQSKNLDRAEWERHADIFKRAENSTLALRPSGRGDVTANAVRWKYSKGAPYVASPLLHNDVLWLVKDGGIVTKLDAGSGELLQQERLPGLGNYYASPVCGDGKVYFASEQGVVSVVAAQRDWQVIASRDFREKIYATPVLTRDRILLRTEGALYCFRGANIQ